MALSIDNPEIDRLARELAATTGESVEQVVLDALRRSALDAMRRRAEMEAKREPTRFPTDEESKRRFRDQIREIQERLAKLPVLDDRSADELLGYDEWGLPH